MPRLTLLLTVCLFACHPFESLEEYPFQSEEVLDTGADSPDLTQGDSTRPPEDIVEVIVPTGPCLDACTETQTCCPIEGDELCIETASNPLSCGECGVVCAEGEICEEGTCIPAPCEGELQRCGQLCADIDNDGEHCGECGNVCGDSMGCLDGSCTCFSGFEDCDGQHENGCEVALALGSGEGGRTSCGGCDIECSLQETCQGGLCACGQQVCGEGEACCEATTTDGTTVETCIDTASNPRHCGGCGVTCGDGEACVEGRCVCGDQRIEGGAVCENGLRCCNGECAFAGSPTCQCATDGDACSGICCAKSCVDYLNDPQNCGGCGKICADGQVCKSGQCRCDAGTLCGGGCTDLRTDPENCGACGVTCGNEQTCCHGQCTSTEKDPTNCGACGVLCSKNQACNTGGCECKIGYADCNGDPSDGCEVFLLSGTAGGKLHCGQCKNHCGDNSLCTSGTCTCNVNFADCNGDASDGCEVNLLFGINGGSLHCGACKATCLGNNRVCDSGNCVCAAGWGDCDKDLRNGCETNLTVGTPSSTFDGRTLNCGACGRTCSADQTCTDGKCTCPEGTLQCDGGRCLTKDNRFDDLSTQKCSIACPSCPGGQTSICLKDQCFCCQ